ncbi:DUF1853 family protein [Thalassobellus suaedae]|uniref:DUF1853 family protein n=1 Tax=Thalassobellus suaedae TaxID=3074124 RepID=A0ABY9Y363_9FLAO|nr:DUF1853 family protein [Flavobacteriaceae bacterium HL-DH10]
MDLKFKQIQLQYQGYLNTPLLWKTHEVFGLKQLELNKQDHLVFNEMIPDNLRLGKRVERFVTAELEKNKHIHVLLENIQIQNEKLTIGELDCILKRDETPIHLEIIYKFYLYDPNLGSTEIEHWIGPNRNDNLLKKLTKLKNKQLPLLHNIYTKPHLDTLNLKAESIWQRVYFKAQLFIPYHANTIDFRLLNKDCLKGFYIPFSEVEQFATCKFYIPNKIDWLIEVQTQIDWLPYNQFLEKITVLINKKTAPLCWVKFPKGAVQKFFVVWWD